VTFEEKYMELKNEGSTDSEIAEMFNVNVSTLKRIKKIHGLSKAKRIRVNRQGVTQDELNKAEENGITHRLALRRVREYHWKVTDAISIPKGKALGRLRKGKRA
jgi:hypothetical protein